MISLLMHEIKSRWAVILGWGFGLIIFGAVYISIFPGMFEQMTAFKDLSIYKIVGMRLGSIEGYMASVVITYMPILVGIYCIVASTSTLAGEEDNGTLELIVAMPLGRWQILAAKAIALSVVVLMLMLIAASGNVVLLEIIPLDTPINITPFGFFMALISSLPLLISLIMISLFLGAILPNRQIATVVMAVYFTASYFGENIAGMVKSLEFIKYFSLFNYFDTTETIFTEGAKLSDVVILLGAAVAFLILALVFFSRRNITTGVWLWQRGKITDSAG
jgi:ABC-2 type transport system permease protein